MQFNSSWWFQKMQRALPIIVACSVWILFFPCLLKTRTMVNMNVPFSSRLMCTFKCTVLVPNCRGVKLSGHGDSDNCSLIQSVEDPLVGRVEGLMDATVAVTHGEWNSFLFQVSWYSWSLFFRTPPCLFWWSSWYHPRRLFFQDKGGGIGWLDPKHCRYNVQVHLLVCGNSIRKIQRTRDATVMWKRS